MMENQPSQPKSPLLPNEMWDQLAVNQLTKALAPQGYKKVMGGKIEVANRQFLSRNDCHVAFTMSANMIRLYRELVKESMEEEIKKAEENLAASKKALDEAGMLEFSAKEGLKERIRRFEVKIELMKEWLDRFDQVKPAAPKKQVKARQEREAQKLTVEQKQSIIGDGSKLVKMN